MEPANEDTGEVKAIGGSPKASRRGGLAKEFRVSLSVLIGAIVMLFTIGTFAANFLFTTKEEAGELKTEITALRGEVGEAKGDVEDLQGDVSNIDENVRLLLRREGYAPVPRTAEGD